MKRVELDQYLSKLLAVKNFKDYCPNGLQVEGKSDIKKVAFAVSATVESIKLSIEWGADALIVHHGVLWDYDGAKAVRGSFGERLKLMIKNDLNLFAYHLPLDGHLEFGNAVQIAKKLKLKNILPFGEYKGAKIGVCGEFSRTCKISELKTHLKKILNHDILHAESHNSLVKNIAILTGGGAKYFQEAKDLGADAFLTGEMSEYHWHSAREENIHLLAAGHHATEKFGVISISEHLTKKFKLKCRFFDSENPV